MTPMLFSVSYAGSWGQHKLDLISFLEKAAALGYPAVELGGKRPHLSPVDYSNAESVALKLMDRRVPYEVTEKRVKMNAERVLAYPGVRFEMDDFEIEATVFPTDGIRQAPVSPVDGKPMRRANKFEVESLLDEQ